MRSAGINVQQVQTCMSQAQPDGEAGDNTILREELVLRERLLIAQLPTFIVNGQILRGTRAAWMLPPLPSNPPRPPHITTL